MVSAASRMMLRPTSTEPVNEILRIVGCFAISAPIAPGPEMTFSTPGGSAWFRTSISRIVDNGV